MLILSNLKTVQGWIEAYNKKYVYGFNYLKSWVGAYQPPGHFSALEAFCVARKAEQPFSDADLITLSKLLLNWAKVEPDTFNAIAPISTQELTVLSRLHDEAKLDEAFYQNLKWETNHLNAAEITAHYTIYYNFFAAMLANCAKPLTNERYTFILTLARRLLLSDPQSITHAIILQMQQASRPLPEDWSKHIAQSDNPALLMQAYFQLVHFKCFLDEENQQALINHQHPTVLADTVVKAAQNHWDDERIKILFKSQNPAEMFDILIAQGSDRRLLPYINGAKSPLALSQFYLHGKTLELDEETLGGLLSAGRNYPSNLERHLDLPLFRDRTVIDFLITHKFNYSALLLVVALRREDMFILTKEDATDDQPFAFVSDIDDFLCAYQTAKKENFLSEPMLKVMLKVKNPQQFVHHMTVAQRLEILGKDLLPLLAQELPETEQHLLRLKDLKSQGKLNATAFAEFMNEIAQNAKQAKPKNGVSVTEVSLFSHAVEPKLTLLSTPSVESTEKPAARLRRSAKR